jgi:hypothetical protein
MAKQFAEDWNVKILDNRNKCDDNSSPDPKSEKKRKWGKWYNFIWEDKHLLVDINIHWISTAVDKKNSLVQQTPTAVINKSHCCVSQSQCHNIILTKNILNVDNKLLKCRFITNRYRI